MEKSIILVIRSHGTIPFTWKHDSVINNRISEVVPLIDPKLFCRKFNIMSLSKFGGVCYGKSNLDLWISLITRQYAEQLKTMSSKEFVQFFFVNPSEDIRIFNEETFGINPLPEFTEEIDFTLNKLYTVGDRLRTCGIHKLQSHNLNPCEEKRLDAFLEHLNNVLNSERGLITRGEILETIRNISEHGVELTLVDLSCDALNPTRESEIYDLNMEQVDWIIKSLQCMRRPLPRYGHESWIHGVRGGKTNKRKNKKISKSKKIKK